MVRLGEIRAAVLLSCVMLAACDQRAPKMSEDELREMQTMFPGMTSECVDKARFGGINAISGLAVDECFEMAPPGRYRGIWRNDFEGSRFCPEPATECGYDTVGDDIWLSYSQSVRSRQSPREGEGGLYQIEFVGRKTAKRGHHGHVGVADFEVIVDQIVSLRPITSASAPN